MPIRRELGHLYPPHWKELSRRVRFERAGGRCKCCGRPHGALIRCLPDGRWFDSVERIWRDGRGRRRRWPDLLALIPVRSTRVVLAAAHLDHDPSNNPMRNLKSLCQRCHLIHDRPYHLAQRWITYRRRYAGGDLFLGRYESFGREHCDDSGAIVPGTPAGSLSPIAVMRVFAVWRSAAGVTRHEPAGAPTPVPH